jgi:hypothetical protein
MGTVCHHCSCISYITAKGKQIMETFDRNDQGIPRAIKWPARKRGKCQKAIRPPNMETVSSEKFLPNLSEAQKPALLIINGY